MKRSGKDSVKNVLGQIPYTAELYWLVRQKDKPLQSQFNLKQLNARLPQLVKDVKALRGENTTGKKIFLFGTLHYWIEHVTLLGLTLAAQGHDVTVGFMPYANWQQEINKFDLRRQNLYALEVLKKAEKVISVTSLMNERPAVEIDEDVQARVDQVSVYDTQYTVQDEDVDRDSKIFKMRMERNEAAARAALTWLSEGKPDIVIVPNGTIQELGVVYQMAKTLNIPSIPTSSAISARRSGWHRMARSCARKPMRCGNVEESRRSMKAVGARTKFVWRASERFTGREFYPPVAENACTRRAGSAQTAWAG